MPLAMPSCATFDTYSTSPAPLTWVCRHKFFVQITDVNCASTSRNVSRGNPCFIARYRRRDYQQPGNPFDEGAVQSCGCRVIKPLRLNGPSETSHDPAHLPSHGCLHLDRSSRNATGSDAALPAPQGLEAVGPSTLRTLTEVPCPY